MKSASLIFFLIRTALLLPVLAVCQRAYPQADSVVELGHREVLLKEVVVRSNLNVPAFIRRVEEDTTFYKAFLNLKVLGYTSLNDVQIYDRHGKIKASLHSRTRQETSHGCRWMKVLEEQTSGNYYNRRHEYNYYTAEMYAGLFFARDTVCGETNVVGSNPFGTQGKSGLEKHKEQLKMLFFNPGRKIPGIPFIGNKIALFDESVARLYNFEIDMDSYHGHMCYVFRITPRGDLDASDRDQIVINNMTTWFRIDNWDIVARQYDLSYEAGVYDFDVRMEVEMGEYGHYLVPVLLRYDGNWDVILHKREKSIFTASLFGFSGGN